VTLKEKFAFGECYVESTVLLVGIAVGAFTDTREVFCVVGLMVDFLHMLLCKGHLLVEAMSIFKVKVDGRE
jgi:hypothetical protein